MIGLYLSGKLYFLFMIALTCWLLSGALARWLNNHFILLLLVGLDNGILVVI